MTSVFLVVEKIGVYNQVLRFKTCFLFGMFLFQPLDLGEDVMIPGLRRWVVKNPPK